MKPNWIFNCQEVSILVSKSLDQELPLRQRLAVKLHLMMCRLCSVNKMQLQKLHELTRFFKKHGKDDTAYFQLPDKSKKRLKEVLKKSKTI